MMGRVWTLPARLTATASAGTATIASCGPKARSTRSAVFGENLTLRRRVEARVGESSFRIHDEVENTGPPDHPHAPVPLQRRLPDRGRRSAAAGAGPRRPHRHRARRRLPHARGSDRRLHGALLRARRDHRARRDRAGRDRQPPHRDGGLPAVQQAPAAAPDDLADAGRGSVCGGHRGEREPRRRPLGCPRAGRADRAGSWRAAEVRPRDGRPGRRRGACRRLGSTGCGQLEAARSRRESTPWRSGSPARSPW